MGGRDQNAIFRDLRFLACHFLRPIAHIQRDHATIDNYDGQTRLPVIEYETARVQRIADAVGLCLEIHDLVISKYVAEREKDLEFIRAAIAHGLVEEENLRHRLESAPIDESRRQRIAAFIGRDFSR